MARERRRHRDDDRENDLHSQIFEVLLDKVREDPYPSTTHLDMLESLLRDDEVEPYAEALMDKVRGDSFPSIDHLNRLMKLA
jgi:uncharacterized protein (DUF2342 family)